jgi:hypothetical protein
VDQPEHVERQGAATLHFSVLPNPNGTPRQARVVVSEQTLNVIQAAAPCRFEVTPTSIHVEAAPAEVSVSLTAPGGCRWSARSDASWIGRPEPPDGVGSATVRIAVAPNTTAARAGTPAPQR